jgi:DNA-binding MarR family transcriptional regulator
MTENRQELMYELAEQLRRLGRVKWFLGNSELDLEGFMILDYLTDSDRTSMSEIVKVLSLPASTATGIVDRLVTKKYVKREHSSDDRRRVEVQITETGRRAHDTFKMTALKTMDESLSHLSVDEIQEITVLVEKLIDRLA